MEEEILTKADLIRNIMEARRVLPSAPLEEILDVALTPLYTSIEELQDELKYAGLGEDL